MRKMLIAAAIAATGTPAVAQVDIGGGLVDVTVQNVSILNNFLNDSEVALLNNVNFPITVQVPVGIAAAVCGVNANVIAQQEERGDYTCTAQNGSRALAQQVLRQEVRQKRD